MSKEKSSISKYLKSYIQLSLVGRTRQSFYVGVLILPLLFIIMPALQPPIDIYSYTLLVPYICLFCWGIWMAFNPYERKRQLLSNLFAGLIGGYNSLGLLIITEKMAYDWLQIQTPFYFLATFVVYFVLFWIMFRWYLQAFRKEIVPGESGVPKGFFYFMGFAALGTFVAKISIKSLSQNGILIVMIGVYLLLSLIFMLLTVHIHKHLIIQKYLDHVTLIEKPRKKRRKK